MTAGSSAVAVHSAKAGAAHSVATMVRGSNTFIGNILLDFVQVNY